MLTGIPRPVLSAGERALLVERRSRVKTARREWVRAVIILEYANGTSLAKTASRAGCCVNTAKTWLRRFLSLREEGLEDLPRSGAPPTYGPEARLMLASQATAAAPDPYTRWSHELLADRMAALGFEVSHTWVGRTLGDLDLDITHTQGWLNRSGNQEEFARRAKDVLDLLVLGPDDGGVIVCVDEKTSIQAIERLYEDIPARAGQLRRIEFDYLRHGVVNLQLAYRHDTGEVLWTYVDSNNSESYIWFLGQISKWVGGGKAIHLVADNGSSHTSWMTKDWLEAHPRFHMHHTPAHASWLNPVELVFSSLTRAVIKGRSSTSAGDLRYAINRWLREREPKPINWRYKWPG